MKFTKSNARFYGRKGGKAATHKKSEKTLLKEAEERAQERARQEEVFSRFEKAESGIFNGYEMADIFHERLNGRKLLREVEADDSANADGVHVGEDGVTVRFFVEPAQAKKQVRFNHSVYVF